MNMLVKYLKAVNADIEGDSLRKISESCGVSHDTLSRVLRGGEPDLKTFVKLCRWLCLSDGDIADCVRSYGRNK